jgi:hypothetical protein
MKTLKELESMQPENMTFEEYERLYSIKFEYNGSEMERSVLKRRFDKIKSLT